MAYFKSNKVETRIANILKGTTDPVSSIGDNGQIYLQYGISNKYEQSQTLGGYVVKEYLVSNAGQFLCTIGGRGYSKSNDGDAIAVVWKHQDFSGPLLISTIPINVYYSYNESGTFGSATIDGVTWYISTNGFWNNPVTLNGVPIFEASYLLDSSNIQTVIEDILEASGFTVAPSTTAVKDTFAKVNGIWQDLIGTEIDDILAGGSKYIKATGSFTSGTESQQKVEVNCGFKPDLVMVDMEFGDGFTRATYLSTAWYEETDHPASVWDLRPMESVIYAITPESETGETGITDLTDSGFKYRVNGFNTQGKACTYTAIKFDAESEPTPVAPFEKEVLHSIVQDQSGSSVPVSVTFTKDYQIAFICGLIADNVYTGAISVNALGGASELYGLSGNRYASGGIAIRLPSNKTLTGYFPYSDGGAYYDIFGAIGMSRLPSECEIGATIDVSNISIELSKVYDHIVVFVGMDSTDSNSITLAMNGTSIPLTVESDKFSRYSYHASQELTSDSITLNFTYSGGTVADNTIVVFAYNE